MNTFRGSSRSSPRASRAARSRPSPAPPRSRASTFATSSWAVISSRPTSSTPRATRRSRSARPSCTGSTGDRVEGTGELTIKGVTEPVELAGAIAAESSTDPFGRERLGLRLETTVDRTAFGVSWNAPNQGGGDYLGNDVTLVAELALVRQES